MNVSRAIVVHLTLVFASAWAMVAHKVYNKVLFCDGQGPVRGAILYKDRSCNFEFFLNWEKTLLL